MRFLPVAARELLVASHSPWLRRLRMLSVLVGVGFAAFFLVVMPPTAVRMGGSGLFNALNFFAFGGICLAGIATTADSISGERRAGTLGFLFLTELSGFDILTGKLASAWVRASTILIALVPLLAFELFLGGVSGSEMLRTSLSLLNLLWGTLVLGISISTRCTQAGTAVAATFVGTAALVLMSTLPSGSQWMRALHHLNPVDAWLHARVPLVARVPDSFWMDLIVSHLAIWTLLLAASLTLPRTLDSSRRWPWPPLRTRRRLSQVGADHGNPVERLCRPGAAVTLLARLVGFGGAFSMLLTLPGVVQMPRVFPATEMALHIVMAAALALKVLYTWHCCESFSNLRAFGLESVLGTGLPERSLPDGVFRAGRRVFIPPGVALIVSSLVVVVPGTVSKFPSMEALYYGLPCVNGILVGLLDFQTIGWWSARSTLMKRGSISPFARTLWIVFGIRTLLFCIPNLLVSAVLFVRGRDRFLIWLRELPLNPPEHLTPSH